MPAGQDSVRAPDEDFVAVGPWPPWMRIAVLLTVAAAMTVFGIRLASTSHPSASHPARPVVAPPSRELTAALYAQQPIAGADPKACPKNVLCSVLDGAPESLSSAIAARLPEAVIRRVHTVAYVSAEQYRVVVWYREIALRLGDADIDVVIHVPKPSDRDSEAAYRIGGQRGVRLQQVFLDRVVALTLTGAGAEPTLGQLRAFVTEPGLVAT